MVYIIKLSDCFYNIHRQFNYQIGLQIWKILLNIYLHLYVLKMGLISE